MKPMMIFKQLFNGFVKVKAFYQDSVSETHFCITKDQLDDFVEEEWGRVVMTMDLICMHCGIEKERRPILGQIGIESGTSMILQGVFTAHFVELETLCEMLIHLTNWMRAEEGNATKELDKMNEAVGSNKFWFEIEICDKTSGQWKEVDLLPCPKNRY